MNNKVTAAKKELEGINWNALISEVLKKKRKIKPTKMSLKKKPRTSLKKKKKKQKPKARENLKPRIPNQQKPRKGLFLYLVLGETSGNILSRKELKEADNLQSRRHA